MLRHGSHLGLVLFFTLTIFNQAQAQLESKAKQAMLNPASDSHWLSNIQKELAQKEYQASINHKGLQSPNRAHNLRIYYTEQGIQVHDRTAAGEPLLFGLRLSQYGRGEDLQHIKPVLPKFKGTRVEYEYNAVLREWFENSREGLEHGFELRQKPKGKGTLRLTMQVDQALIGNITTQSLQLHTRTGRRLEYKALQVFDAHGATVPATMQRNDNEIVLAIDDRHAVWPLTVDPLLTSTDDTLLEVNQADAAFGVSVASAGDVNGDGFADVIVGAHLYDNGEMEEGAAFVFRGSATGLSSSFSTRLESNQANSFYGYSVAGAGDVNGDGYSDVIVGAFFYDNGITANDVEEGAAFVYLGGMSGVSSTANAVLDPNQANAFFGYSVASAGDVDGDGYTDVIVGAFNYSDGEENEGAVFVFHGSASGIDAVANTQLESNQERAVFGFSVASAGDVNGDGFSDVMVGAHLYDNTDVDDGSVFIYHGSDTGIENAASTELLSDQVAVGYGYSVAGIGDVNGDGYGDVMVGVFSYTNGEDSEGAAFVYHGSNAGIAQAFVTQLEANQARAQFGSSVAAAGDVNGDGYSDVIVGAKLFDNGEVNEGAAFIYHGSVSGIRTTVSQTLESNQAGGRFGVSVAGAGDLNGDGYSDVIVGADYYDKIENGEGAAFIYHGGFAGLTTTAAIQLESNQESAFFGFSIAGAGDVNADGFSDVIVGAYRFDNGEVDEGAAFVYHGSTTGLGINANRVIQSNQANAQLGASVAGAGDVDGDGYSDIIIGAHLYDDGQNDEGVAFIHHGSAAGVSSLANTSLQVNQVEASFALSVASAGDVNSDGFADVIIGAPLFDNGEQNEGAAFVYHGSATGLETTFRVRLESNKAQARFGESVAGAGDVNGDGHSDIVVGAYQYTNDLGNEGAAFVYHGTAIGLSPVVRQQLGVPVPQANAAFGVSVAGIGDVNGDKYGDIAVGAHLYNDGQSNEGAVFIYHGSDIGVGDVANLTLQSDQVGAQMGVNIAAAGDINEDGFNDIIVGAPFYDDGQTVGGVARIYYGPLVDSSVPIIVTQLAANQVAAGFGFSVAGAGDVNGDGYSDVIVGAYLYDNIEIDEGAVFVYHGNADVETIIDLVSGEESFVVGNGRPVQARQYSGSDTTQPLQPVGLSENVDHEFTISLNGIHPAGRGAIKIQLERCKASLAFGDAEPGCKITSSPDWVRVVPVGAAMLPSPPASVDAGDAVSFTSSVPTDGLYKWRARLLYADETVFGVGVTSPGNPTHGPWRRVASHTAKADLRISDGDNASPSIPSITMSAPSFAEDTPAGTVVATVVSTDADNSQPAYLITAGNRNNAFSIDVNTGVITVAALDYETDPAYTLTVTVTDGVNSVDKNVTVMVDDVNEAPVIVSGTGTFALVDDAGIGTVVTTIVADDPEPTGPGITYTITKGNDDGKFAIDLNTGVVTVAGTLDFDKTSTYQLMVEASDVAFNTSGIVNVDLTKFGESPVINGGTGNFSVAEDVAIGSEITTIIAEDPQGDKILYLINEGNDSGAFTIDESTGVITVASALDFETTTHYKLVVHASDGLLDASGTVTVDVSDVTETVPNSTPPASGGCSLRSGAAFDPLMPWLLLMGFVYLWRGRRNITRYSGS